jgi:hypothetical protein
MDTDEGAAHLDAEELRERYRDWVVTMCTSRQGEVGVPTLAELERHRPQDQLYYEWRAYDMVVAALTGVARPLFRAEMSEVRDFSRAGHIVYGRAKVWVVPPIWGDGGENVLVIGTRRGSHGRRLVRQVIGSEKLVNFRAQRVFSRRDWEWMVSPYEGLPLPLWGGDGVHQDVSGYAVGRGVCHLEEVHLRGMPWRYIWRQPLHPRDQKCAFCQGAGVRFDDGAGQEPNPYEDVGPGTDVAELLNRRLWDAGHRYAALLRAPTIPQDSPLAGLVREATARHEKAVELAPDLVGRLVDDVRTVRAEDPDHWWSAAPLHFTNLDE